MLHRRASIIALFATLVVVPAAHAAPDVGARLDVQGLQVSDNSPYATVGDTVTVVGTLRNPGIDAVANAMLTISMPATIRAPRITAPAGVTCTLAAARVDCAFTASQPGIDTSVSISGMVWRSGAIDLTATSSVAGDTNPINDSVTSRFGVLRQSTGDKCSILGTAKADVLIGVAGDDRICALAGNDVIKSLAGDDRVFGGAGNDRILGGPGSDWLSGGPGQDLLLGGAGNDGLHGDAGHDVIRGEAGGDSLLGGAGNDSLLGGPSLDAYLGDAGNDRIQSCDGIGEYVIGGAGRDTVIADKVDQLLAVESRSGCRG